MKTISKLLFSLTLGIGQILSLQATESNMQEQQPTAFIETNQGTIEVALRPDIAPKAVENFIRHAETGYYDGVILHRVIKSFMIQGGDPQGTGVGGASVWGKPFEDEVTTSVTFAEPGVLAMANAGPKTNGSQFFITTAATPWLNNKHTIFGKVVNGYDVVQKIENTPTGSRDKPLEDQKIVHITIKNSPSYKSSSEVK